MTASPRFGYLTVSDLLTGPQVSCFVLLAADEVYVYGAAPAGQFQELHGAAEVAPSCEDGEDPLPGVVNIEYVAVTRDLVENFGDDAAGRMPAPFRDDGAWPDSDAVILAMPEGFAEELWDFQSAAASAPELPPVLVELPGAGRGRGGNATGTAPAVPKGRPSAASNARTSAICGPPSRPCCAGRRSPRTRSPSAWGPSEAQGVAPGYRLRPEVSAPPRRRPPTWCPDLRPCCPRQ